MPSHAQSIDQPAASLASAAPSGRLLGLRLPFSGVDAGSDGDGQAYALQMRPADHGRLTTTIEGRLASGGPIGSLGLQTSRDGPDIPLYDLDNAAVMGPRGPEAKIGARIAYRF